MGSGDDVIGVAGLVDPVAPGGTGSPSKAPPTSQSSRTTPPTCSGIVVAAKTGACIAHVAQRICDDRDRAAAQTALHADLTKQGVPVIERPAYDDRKVTDLWSLRATATATATDTTPLEVATQQSCAGHAAYISAGYARPRPVYVCTDPRAHGHHKPGGGPAAGPMTEEEKQARREVIENNKAWDAAETVRGQWITA